MADDKSSVTLLVSKIVRDGNIQVRVVRPGVVPVRGAGCRKIPMKQVDKSENRKICNPISSRDETQYEEIKPLPPRSNPLKE